MKVVTAGRNPDGNDIVISDPMVSRYHFQILQDDDGSFRLIDLGSLNGTYVNGRRVKGEVDLGVHDIVRVGNTIVRWKQHFDHLDYPTMEGESSPSYVQTGERRPMEEVGQTGVDEPEEDNTVRLALIITGIVVGLGMIVLALGRL